MNYKFNTGDIIFISYKGLLQVFNEKFTRRKYVHNGIVVDGENKLIIHITKSNGVITIEKIDMNFLLNNEIIELAVLPIRKPIDNLIIKNSYKKFLHLKYNYNTLIYLDSVNNIIPNVKFSGYSNNTIICYELVAFILHDIGIITNIKCKTYKYNIDNFINLPAYDKHNITTFLVPSYTFNFGTKYLYNKILELFPIPKFIGNDCSNYYL
jgi:hypothetical protein